MREDGKTAKELAGLFGYTEKHLRDAAALGFLPGLSKLSGTDNPSQDDDSTISMLDARQFLLPLRAWPVDVPKNDKNLDYSLYDYTEVTACIDKLVSGALLPADLSAYSAERSESIARAQEGWRQGHNCGTRTMPYGTSAEGGFLHHSPHKRNLPHSSPTRFRLCSLPEPSISRVNFHSSMTRIKVSSLLPRLDRSC
jgi:hypothetical protein